MFNRQIYKRIVFLLVFLGGFVSFLHLVFAQSAAAGGVPLPSVSVKVGQATNPKDVAVTLQILLLLTVLSLAPAIIIMVTSFTRIVIVLAFVRQAMATQQVPPNQVLIALALFLTFFVMSPTLNKINNEAFQPYLKGKITQQEALQRSTKYLREFMFRQTRPNDLALFVRIAKGKEPVSREDVPTSVLIPAFVISELKTAFQIGFVIFIPFLIIDLVVASTLISMGMLLLPPVIISFPFKLLLFIMVDGWHLITRSLVYSFH